MSTSRDGRMKLTGQRLRKQQEYQALVKSKLLKKSEYQSAVEWLETDERLIQEKKTIKKLEKQNVAKAKREKESLEKRVFKVSFPYKKQVSKKGKKHFITNTIFGVDTVQDNETFRAEIEVSRNKSEPIKSFRGRISQLIQEYINSKNAEFTGTYAEGESKLEWILSGQPTMIDYKNRPVGMTRAKPWAYENSGFYSIAEYGKCVPTSLWSILESSLGKRYSYDKLVFDLTDGQDDMIPITAEQIESFCKEKDITCFGVDDEWNQIAKHIAVSRNHKPIYFVRKDEHFYVMEKDKAMEFLRSNSKSRKVEKESETKVERENVIVSNVSELSLESENVNYIVGKVSDLRQAVAAYMTKTHVVPKMTFGATIDRSIYLKSFEFGSNRVCFNPHPKVLSLGHSSMREFAYDLFGQHYDKLPTSSMNHIVYSVFKEWKKRQHFAHLFAPNVWKATPGMDQCWDANKAYTNALRNTTYNWLLFDELCLPELWDGVYRDAYYFVQTHNSMPCFGNEWCSRVKIDFMIAQNISFTVLYELKPSSVLPHDYFKTFVDVAIKTSSDFKHIVNTFVGSLNMNDNKVSRVIAGASKDEILHKCFTTKAHFTQFQAGDETIYCAADVKTTPKFQNNMPIYAQVLDFAAVELAKVMIHLEKKGCVIGSYNTDSITFKHTDMLEIDVSNHLIGGWKLEEPKEYVSLVLPKIENKVYSFDIPSWKRVETEDTIDIVSFLKTNCAMLSGPAGYGKSWVINELVSQVGIDTVCLTAYTNIASNNVGGGTFHKQLHINRGDKNGMSVESLLEGKSHWIIDEISQVPSNLYSHIIEAKRLGKIVILAGDFSQIQPVDQSQVASNSSILPMICENHVSMTKYKRGDASLLSALNKVRAFSDGCLKDFDVCKKGQMFFCFTKKMRDMLNEEEMKKHSGREIEGLKKIYPGMILRSVITKQDGSWLNNERWEVVKAGNAYSKVMIVSKLRGFEIEVDDKILAENFVPGYAMTIHSSQGLTVKESYTLFIEKYTKFDADTIKRLIYTGLSRGVSLSQIGIQYVK